MTTARHSQGARGAPRHTKGAMKRRPSGTAHQNGQSPRPRTYPERALHAAVAAYLRVALPDAVLWTTVGHGGGGKVRGAQLKAAGMVAGWPDVQLLVPVPWYGQAPRFIGIELKAKSGRLSPEQIACHARIRAAGGEVIVCRSVEEVEQKLRALGVPLRATVGRAA